MRTVGCLRSSAAFTRLSAEGGSSASRLTVGIAAAGFSQAVSTAFSFVASASVMELARAILISPFKRAVASAKLFTSRRTAGLAALRGSRVNAAEATHSAKFKEQLL